jgi:hypothetical protein
MTEFCRELEACLRESRTGEYAPVPRRARRARRRVHVPLWPIALLLLGALAAAVAVIVWAVSRSGSSGGSAHSGGPVVPHLRGSAAFDPFGDGREHDDRVTQATDDNGSTYWETERYLHGLAGVPKKGVGLVLDAGKAVTLHRVGIATDTPGFIAVIRAGSRPNYFPHWISQPQTVESRTQFDITAGGSYRYYLVWITKLGQGYDQAHVNEVKAS